MDTATEELVRGCNRPAVPFLTEEEEMAEQIKERAGVLALALSGEEKR